MREAEFFCDWASTAVEMNWRFRRPIHLEDRVQVRGHGVRCRAIPGGQGAGFVTLQLSLLNQCDQAVQDGRWTLLVEARPDPRTD